MSEYIIEFSKTGTICFTSHLDLMRMFKRAFKRTDTPLAYSAGFNPHPKMGFAQPLSLGYWGMQEYIQFETLDEWEPEELIRRLSAVMPEGVELKACLRAEHLTKTLASHTESASYMIEIPLREAKELDPRKLWHGYMDQDQILAWKRQKKKKDLKQVDIKPMIRKLAFLPEDRALFIDCLLDCGSASNLSPEQVISSVLERFDLDADRSEISVMRKRIYFDKPLDKLLEG